MSDGRSERSGSGLEHARGLLRVDLDPGRDEIHFLRDGQRFLNAELALRALAQANLVTGTDLI